MLLNNVEKVERDTAAAFADAQPVGVFDPAWETIMPGTMLLVWFVATR